ncbi:sialidase family protein [Acinetobacter baumannii]|uniref:sialidase family protein n=1 Tax=Acinetobacter baumannii TaxID=470 RepID=UPI0024B859E5|nr:sialidase family protein [Acinetobacter baumannii]MDI9820502.1 sialidase family protein [Acinetobacter baumannii]
MAIPNKDSLIGPTVTESEFKFYLGVIVDFLKLAESYSPVFATTALLQASRPESSTSFAKALDTGKVWYWNKPANSPAGNYWTVTNLSDLDQAKDYANLKAQSAISENIPEYDSEMAAHWWELKDESVLMWLTPDAELNVDEIQTSGFRRENLPGILHLLSDSNELVSAAFLDDGSVYFEKPFEDRYLSSVAYRPYIELDKQINKNVEPYFFEEVVAPYGADGKLHQRMAATIRVSENKLFVVFSQYATANQDPVDARLVGRFVTFDVPTKQISVDENTIIMYDPQNASIGCRHPNLIKLKDGRFMCLFNKTLIAGAAKSPLYAIYSDDCVTWSEPVLKLADNNDNFAFTAPTTIQRIHTGKYKDRLIMPIYSGNWEVRLIFSDDDGETWKVGQKWSGLDFGDANLQTNETNITIDIDGSVIAHCRTEKNDESNRYLYIVKSSDGGETVDFVGRNLNFQVSNCAVGMLQTAQKFGEGIPKILVSRPTSLTHFSRNHFMISASYDGLRTSQYDYKPYADNVNVGYTHLLALDDQNFVLTMEKGTEINNGNNYISIAFFNIAEVMKNGQSL